MGQWVQLLINDREILRPGPVDCAAVNRTAAEDLAQYAAPGGKSGYGSSTIRRSSGSGSGSSSVSSSDGVVVGESGRDSTESGIESSSVESSSGGSSSVESSSSGVQAAMASKGSVSAWIYGDNLVDSGGPGAINRDATRFLFRSVGE